MAARHRRWRLAGATALLLVAACSGGEQGPLRVDAIGDAPERVNPNLRPLDAPRGFLLYATAQGLVRFDAGGQVEPALAESWIVSDDGLRYTFRLAPGRTSEEAIPAEQVVRRLRAALSRASRNPLKPTLGLVERVEAMTGRVLEIRLVAPRPNFLQLLAQPEMAILIDGAGTGPYVASPADGGRLLLAERRPPVEDFEAGEGVLPSLLLRGTRAADAVARFADGQSDLVIGGTAAELPLARVARLPRGTLRYDPVSGHYGLEVMRAEGLLGDAARRDALSSVIDRAALTETIGAPDPQPRASLLPAGIADGPVPTAPAWALLPIEERRAAAQRVLTDYAGARQLRIAVPESYGSRLLIAHLARDLSAIGVEISAVRLGAAADLRLVDLAAPAAIGAWYLRHFQCGRSAVCDPAADVALAAARVAPSAAERREQLAQADRLLTAAVPFIPLSQPVRWSLVGRRATGWQPNGFGLRFPGSLVAER